jgi:hypothetical protein
MFLGCIKHTLKLKLKHRKINKINNTTKIIITQFCFDFLLLVSLSKLFSFLTRPLITYFDRIGIGSSCQAKNPHAPRVYIRLHNIQNNHLKSEITMNLRITNKKKCELLNKNYPKVFTTKKSSSWI